MNKGKYISKLSPGDELHGDVFVVSEVEEVNAGGYRFISMMLSDKSGRCKATYGNVELPAPLLLYQARLLSIDGFVQTKEKYRGQIKVDEFKVVAVPADLSPYLHPPCRKSKNSPDPLQHSAQICTGTNLKRLLRTIFDPQKDVWPRFKHAVAAQGIHHAYPGGLVEHSAEVAELCDHACVVLPQLRRDSLITCALLHDIGKLDEMEHGLGVGRYTESGTLMGHVFSGAYLIRASADSLLISRTF